MEVVQVEAGEQTEERACSMSLEARDKPVKENESTQQEERYETESDDPPIEFQDPMYEFMQEAEIEEEYAEMTQEQEEEFASQLTP